MPCLNFSRIGMMLAVIDDTVSTFFFQRGDGDDGERGTYQAKRGTPTSAASAPVYRGPLC